MLSLHKARAMLVGQRTQTANTLRSLLAEFGAIAAQGIAAVRKVWVALPPDALPAAARSALGELAFSLAALEERIGKLDKEILAQRRANPVCARLETIRASAPSPPPRWRPMCPSQASLPPGATSRHGSD